VRVREEWWEVCVKEEITNISFLSAWSGLGRCKSEGEVVRGVRVREER
jgi:hypothetical protein